MLSLIKFSKLVNNVIDSIRSSNNDVKSIKLRLTVGIEQLFLKVRINNTNFILSCIYIPPSATNKTYSSHCEVVETLYTIHQLS